MALHQLRNRPELRERLWRNARALSEGLASLGLKLGADASPVVGVRFEDAQQALGAWHRLLESGVYTNLIAPPASPDGSSLLRVSTSAAHSLEQIQTIVETFRRVVV